MGLVFYYPSESSITEEMVTDGRDGMCFDMILEKRKIRLLDRLLLSLIVFRDGKSQHPPRALFVEKVSKKANEQGLNNDSSISQTQTPSPDIRTIHTNSPSTPSIEELRFALRSDLRNARNFGSSIITNPPGCSVGSWDSEGLAESFEIDGS